MSADGEQAEIATTRLRYAPTSLNRLGPFRLFTSTKASIRKALGPASQQRAKGGECCGDVLCYFDESEQVFVEFQFGPSGGFEKLTGYRVTNSASAYPKTRGCERSAKVGNVTGASAVRIGDPAEALATTLRLPAPPRDGRKRFQYEEKVPFTQTDKMGFLREGKTPPEEAFWDLVYSIDVVVKDGVVREFEVTRTETF